VFKTYISYGENIYENEKSVLIQHSGENLIVDAKQTN